MRINFFEEFPESSLLDKACLIDFNSTIYIAAQSYIEFEKWKKKLERVNHRCEAAYWPILKKSYWVSPFTFTHELKELLADLESNKGKEKLKVLIDLEIPLRRNLYLRNIFSFFRNRSLIKQIFLEAKDNNIEILTAEYPASGETLQFLWRLLGLSYDLRKYSHKRIVMYYSSMLRLQDKSREWLVKIVRNFIIKKNKKNPELQVGLGTIDVGVLGNEPILAPDELAADMDFLKGISIHTAIIFRLNGLNNRYLKVIHPYLDSYSHTV